MSEYAFVHDGKAVTPDRSAVAASEAAARNAAIEAAELRDWAERPDRAVAYYDDRAGTIATWPGTVIGRITSQRIYRHNFGGRMICIRARGTNGAEYHGRASFDGGTVIRLRRAKR